jgi:hypothetical protein
MSWIEHITRVLDPTGLLPVGVVGNADGEPDYSLLIWGSDEVPKPTEEEFSLAVAKAKEMSYQTDRRNAYPSIPEQLDLLFHGGLEAWREQIQAIKDEHPKP